MPGKRVVLPEEAKFSFCRTTGPQCRVSEGEAWGLGSCHGVVVLRELDVEGELGRLGAPDADHHGVVAGALVFGEELVAVQRDAGEDAGFT
jgi:hypothetical protein